MAVNLVRGFEREVDRVMGLKIQEIVAAERGFAPVDTGNLAGSITGRKVSLGKYIVTTNAVGRNGFAYPAWIEFGETIYPTNKKVLHFIAHGRQVYAKSAGPSAQSHYAQKTISAYGGRYSGK